MPRDKDLEPITGAHWTMMDAEAIGRCRIRVQGVVVAKGDGYSGRYRNVWIQIAIGDVRVQVTATPGSALASAPRGAELDLGLTLTGLVDVARGVYFGQQARRPRL